MQDLALVMARDTTRLRSELQLVFFAAGQVKQSLVLQLELQWRKAGEFGRPSRSRAAAQGPALQSAGSIVGLGLVKSFPLLQKSQRPLISSDYCVGSLGNSLRPPGDARSWVLVFSFTASAAGRELRGSLALAGVFSRNGDGAWPDLGFKMGVPRPSKYVQRVCEVANLPPKGKGKKS